MRGLLVVKDGAVGDSLLLAPALAEVRRAHPGARIDLAGAAWRLRLLVGPTLADAARSIDDADSLAAYDEVVVFAFDPDDPFVAGVRRRATGRVEVRPHFPEPGSGVHVADHVQRALAHVGAGPAADRLYRLPVPEEARRWAAGFVARHRPEVRPRVYVHPGTKIPTKRWPPERFAALCEKLAERGARLFLGHGPMDDETNAPVEAALAGTDFVPARGHNLVQTAGLLAAMDAYVGVDSGVTHLAALVGTPTVAIYGPTSPAMWGPVGPRVRVLAGTRSLPCCRSDHPRDCEGGCTALVSLEGVLESLALIAGAPGSAG